MVILGLLGFYQDPLAHIAITYIRVNMITSCLSLVTRLLTLNVTNINMYILAYAKAFGNNVGAFHSVLLVEHSVLLVEHTVNFKSFTAHLNPVIQHIVILEQLEMLSYCL